MPQPLAATLRPGHDDGLKLWFCEAVRHAVWTIQAVECVGYKFLPSMRYWKVAISLVPWQAQHGTPLSHTAYHSHVVAVLFAPTQHGMCTDCSLSRAGRIQLLNSFLTVRRPIPSVTLDPAATSPPIQQHVDFRRTQMFLPDQQAFQPNCATVGGPLVFDVKSSHQSVKAVGAQVSATANLAAFYTEAEAGRIEDVKQLRYLLYWLYQRLTRR